MIQVLEYNNDVAMVHLRCRVTRPDSPQEFAYEIEGLLSEHDTLWQEQAEHLLPENTTAWHPTEELARQDLVAMVTEAFDTFGTWPQYKGHPYIPGEFFDGDDKAYPPGIDPHVDEQV